MKQCCHNFTSTFIIFIIILSFNVYACLLPSFPTNINSLTYFQQNYFRQVNIVFRVRHYINTVLLLLLLPECSILMRVLEMALCLSVCHKSVFYRNGWTNRTVFCMGDSFDLSYTLLGNSGTFNNTGTSLWNFAPNSRLRKILSQHIDRRSVLPTELEKGGRSKCDKLGRRQSTKSLDHCSLSHRSSTSVYSTILSCGSICDSWYLLL